MSKLSFAFATTLIAGLIAGAALAPQAQARSGVEVGALTCHIAAGTGYVFGSTRDMRCTFAPIGGGHKQYYVGHIDRFGLDIGVTGKTIMGWAVFAPTRAMKRGALAGSYAGVAADASLGLGAGAKVLVGGSKRTISLQPVSVQGQSGVNLALTVASMELHPAR